MDSVIDLEALRKLFDSDWPKPPETTLLWGLFDAILHAETQEAQIRPGMEDEGWFVKAWVDGPGKYRLVEVSDE